MRVRRVSGADKLQVIANLDSIVFPSDYPISDWDEAAWWLGYEKDKPVCYAGAKLLGDMVYLSRVGVLPKYRGKGFQRQLIRARLEFGRRNGCTVAITYTSRYNFASMRSLIKCGFLPYYPEHDWAGDQMYWTRNL